MNNFFKPISLSLLLFSFALVAYPVSCYADNRLAAIFQDNMVLQREMPVPIWGWSSPGTKVEVDFAGQSKQATADAKGYWKAILDPLTVNATSQDLTAKIGSTTITRKNVLVGEVWLSAGHSNTVAPGPDLDTGIYPLYVSPGFQGGKPEIRIFEIDVGVASKPLDDFDTYQNVQWKTLQEVPPMKVMNEVQFFAQVVRDALNVPVGILQPVSVGVHLPTWIERKILEASPATDGKSANFYQQVFDSRDIYLAKEGLPFRSWAEFEKMDSDWHANKQGPWPGMKGFVTLHSYPSGSYNAKVYPLAPYALRGLRWNADAAMGSDADPRSAAERTVAAVKQWRQLWGEDFYFINCTRMRYTTGQPPLIPLMVDNSENDSIRDAQKLFGDDKHNDFVEFTDLGNWYSHYLEKQEAGRRLGLCALNLAYGQKNIYSGPRMAEIKIEGNKATVRFDLVGDGIKYQPSIDGISGIYLRDKSGKSAWAQVNVTGKDTIECSSPGLSSLETIAYGHNVNPHETLFNSAGLPASPFVQNPPAGYPPASPNIASFLDGQKSVLQVTNSVIKGGTISMAHVRRTGDVFKIAGQEPLDLALKPIAGATTPNIGDSTATTPVLAYIPAEWQGYEVVTGDKYGWDGSSGTAICTGLKAKGGKPLEATETPQNGAKFITFNAPVDGTWIIVAEKGKAADFAKVNRY